MKKYFLINYTTEEVGHCVIVGERTRSLDDLNGLHLIKVFQNLGWWETGDMINITSDFRKHITFESDNLQEVMDMALLEVL